MLMSSGIYRPRFFEEGLLLPKVFGPKTAKEAAQQQQQQKQQPISGDAAAAAVQRTETGHSLTQNSSSSSSLRGKQRKMAFAKSGRKQLTEGGLISDGVVEAYHQPVIEAAEDGGAGQRESSPEGSSNRVSTPTNTNAVQTTAAAAAADCPQVSSPVNSSGVHILIDLSSDVECDDDDDDDTATADAKTRRRGSDAGADDDDDAPGKTGNDPPLLVDLEAVDHRETAIATRSDDCESRFGNRNSAQRVENSVRPGEEVLVPTATPGSASPPKPNAVN